MPADTPRLTVVSGPVKDTDTLGQFKNPQNNDFTAIWNDFFVQQRYENDSHTYMMPLSSPDTTNVQVGYAFPATVAFAKIANSTLLWISDWTCSRFKLKPKIPNSRSNNPNWVLLHRFLEPASITVGPDGVTPLYRISGTYIYGCLNPDPDLINDTNFARPPWLEDVYNLRVTPDMLESGLIGI